MKLIICIDEKKGILFNKRRQSRDSVLCQYILDLVGENKIAMSEYSSKIFPETERVFICENILESQAEFVFAEEKIKDISGFSELYIFNWNRRYPADEFFNFDVENLGFVLKQEDEFAGSSHDKITLSRFIKEN